MDDTDSNCEHAFEDILRQVDVLVATKKHEWETQLKACQDKLRSKEQQLYSFSRLEAEHREENSRLRNQLSQLSSTSKELTQRYEKTISILQRELAEVRARSTTLEESYRSELHQLQLHLRTVNQELESMRAMNTQKSGVSGAEVQEQAERFEQELSNAYAQQHVLRARVAELERELQDEKRSARSLASKSQREDSERRTRVSSAESELQVLRSELDAARADARKERVMHQREMASLTADIEAYKDAIRSRDDGIAELRQALKRATSLHQGSTDVAGSLRQKAEKLERKLAVLKARQQELEQARGEAERGLHHERNEKDAIARKAAKLETSLVAAQSHIAVLETQLQEKDSEAAETSSLLRSMQIEEQQHAAQSKQLDSIRARVHQLEEELDVKDSAIRDKSIELSDLRAQLQSLQEVLREKASALLKSEGKLKALREEALSNQEVLVRQLNTANSKLQEADDERHSLRSRLHALESTARELKEQAETQQQDNVSLRKALSDATQRLNDALLEKEDLEHRLNSASLGGKSSGEFDPSQAQHHQPLQEQVERLKNELRDKVEKLLAAEAAEDQVRSQLTQLQSLFQQVMPQFVQQQARLRALEEAQQQHQQQHQGHSPVRDEQHPGEARAGQTHFDPSDAAWIATEATQQSEDGMAAVTGSEQGQSRPDQLQARQAQPHQQQQHPQDREQKQPPSYRQVHDAQESVHDMSHTSPDSAVQVDLGSDDTHASEVVTQDAQSQTDHSHERSGAHSSAHPWSVASSMRSEADRTPTSSQNQPGLRSAENATPSDQRVDAQASVASGAQSSTGAISPSHDQATVLSQNDAESAYAAAKEPSEMKLATQHSQQQADSVDYQSQDQAAANATEASESSQSSRPVRSNNQRRQRQQQQQQQQQPPFYARQTWSADVSHVVASQDTSTTEQELAAPPASSSAAAAATVDDRALQEPGTPPSTSPDSLAGHSSPAKDSPLRRSAQDSLAKALGIQMTADMESFLQQENERLQVDLTVLQQCLQARQGGVPPGPGVATSGPSSGLEAVLRSSTASQDERSFTAVATSANGEQQTRTSATAQPATREDPDSGSESESDDDDNSDEQLLREIGAELKRVMAQHLGRWGESLGGIE